MEFSIKKNSTLPILKAEIVKDGRSDFNLNSYLSATSEFYISLFDDSNDTFLFASNGCYVTTETSTFSGEDLYFINYKFSKKDTKKPGRYSAKFLVKSSEGTINLPIKDKF